MRASKFAGHVSQDAVFHAPLVRSEIITCCNKIILLVSSLSITVGAGLPGIGDRSRRRSRSSLLAICVHSWQRLRTAETTDNQILHDSADSGLAARLDPQMEDAAAQSPHSARPSPARPHHASAVASARSRRSTRAAGHERERTSARFSNAGKGKSSSHT